MPSHTERLREALVKARDTFAELELVLKAFGRPIMAQACRVARDGCNEALSDELVDLGSVSKDTK